MIRSAGRFRLPLERARFHYFQHNDIESHELLTEAVPQLDCYEESTPNSVMFDLTSNLSAALITKPLKSDQTSSGENFGASYYRLQSIAAFCTARGIGALVGIMGVYDTDTLELVIRDLSPTPDCDDILVQ
ncbi:hypothetical protein INS49_014358 [Diaporthe citri]|uniref:uncharacterized protein n=1 Tax=Diaporthe citri TaxID=83186 RepID=UPI001C8071CC|nr:uncharacterized protein INS49_014358 [Diaporthe citri]KAG6358474.1 hypothetical protein INS49_014358 [Diaporthe citri]